MPRSTLQGLFQSGLPQYGPAHAPVIQRFGGGLATHLPPGFACPDGRGGHPLPLTVREKLEPLFGSSFGDVQVHEGPHAAAIGALAFTVGTHIYFAPGQYNPSTLPGWRLLGHELAHVVQQRAGRVRSPSGGGATVIHDPGLEAEADRMGNHAVQVKVLGAVPAVLRAPPGRQADAGGAGCSRPALAGVIQPWTSQFYSGELGEDQWLVVLVNENASVHGHTVLLIQGPGWTQTVNFMPVESVVSTKTGQLRTLDTMEKATGRRNSVGQVVPGIVVERSRPGENETHLSDQIGEKATAILITPKEGQKLQELIERDKSHPPPYATVGHPLNLFGGSEESFENCQTWAVSILQEAGIEVPLKVRNLLPASNSTNCIVQ